MIYVITIIFSLVIYIPSQAQQQNKANFIWSDEFDGTSLDSSKWSYRFLGPRRDGINAKEAVSHHPKPNHNNKTFKQNDKYFTGMIGTQGKFEHTYGYWDCRMQFQKQIGHWSAFWLQSPTYGKIIGDAKSSGAEIDIIEFLVNTKHLLRHNIHWDGYKEHHKHVGEKLNFQGLDKGFHLIGLEWTEEEYIFYVDGKETWRTNKGISHRQQYIILSLEVGKWADDISKATLPDSMIVDYVRVFREKP